GSGTIGPVRVGRRQVFAPHLPSKVRGSFFITHMPHRLAERAWQGSPMGAEEDHGDSIGLQDKDSTGSQTSVQHRDVFRLNLLCRFAGGDPPFRPADVGFCVDLAPSPFGLCGEVGCGCSWPALHSGQAMWVLRIRRTAKAGFHALITPRTRVPGGSAFPARMLEKPSTSS
ncbi:MAG: hypothetical protein RL346_748, partial [Verrucomicrobiota bacterium]